MWQLVKAELRYNSDILTALGLFFLAMMMFTFFLGQGYLGSERIAADWIAYFILGAGIFFPMNIKIRWNREKRDRLHVLLPFSLNRIGLARIVFFLILLAFNILAALFLFGWFRHFFPGVSTTFLSLSAICGFVLLFNAVYYFLVTDLQGYVVNPRRPFGIAMNVWYRVFRLILIIVGIIIALTAFLVTQIGQVPQYNPFGRFLQELYQTLFMSPLWTVMFIVFGVAFIMLAGLVFTHRRSFMD